MSLVSTESVPIESTKENLREFPNWVGGNERRRIVNPYGKTDLGMFSGESEKNAYPSTLEAILKLAGSRKPEEANLGKTLYERILKRTDRAVSFVKNGQTEAVAEVKQPPTVDLSLKFSEPDIQSMAGIVSEELSGEAKLEISIPYPQFTFTFDKVSLPDRLTLVSEVLDAVRAEPETVSQVEYKGLLIFSAEGIKAQFDLPTLQKCHPYLVTCSTRRNFESIRQKYREANPAVSETLKTKAADGDLSAKAQHDLLYTPIGIATDAVSPENPQEIAELAVRRGYVGTIDASVRQKIAVDLLKKLGTNLNGGEINESLASLRLASDQGDFEIRVSNGQLEIKYLNPKAFKTNPGKYWVEAVREVEKILDVVYAYHGLPIKTAEIEIPQEYRDIRLPNLETLTPENNRRHIGWIGGYAPKTMDKINQATNALVQNFEGEKSPFNVAPNILVDGLSGSGKTEISLAIMSEAAEKLSEKGVAFYRLKTTENTTIEDIVRDVRTWRLMKGKSVLLVEDIWQKMKDRKPKDVASALSKLADLAKEVADSEAKNKVMIWNTEYLSETTQGRRAMREAHRFPHTLTLELDRTSSGLEDCFRGILARNLSSKTETVLKSDDRVGKIAEPLKSAWQALLSLQNADLLEPGILNQICDDAISEKGSVQAVDIATILRWAPIRIEDKRQRVEDEKKKYPRGEIEEKVELFAKVLKPAIELESEVVPREDFEIILRALLNPQGSREKLLALAEKYGITEG